MHEIRRKCPFKVAFTDYISSNREEEEWSLAYFSLRRGSGDGGGEGEVMALR